MADALPRNFLFTLRAQPLFGHKMQQMLLMPNWEMLVIFFFIGIMNNSAFCGINYLQLG